MRKKKPDLSLVLGLPMRENGAGAKTVLDYLKELLSRVWEEGEGFSGKRPFGDSGWDYELFAALADAGIISYEFKEDDPECFYSCPYEFSEKQEGEASVIISRAIRALVAPARQV